MVTMLVFRLSMLERAVSIGDEFVICHGELTEKYPSLDPIFPRFH